MTTCISTPFFSMADAQRGRLISGHGASAYGAFRLPTDPLFYADLTLENIVVGSRYRITRHSNGEELATGVAASASEVVSGLPVYSNPMLIDITVRKASGSPNYVVFDTAAYIGREGVTSYILQQLDE